MKYRITVYDPTTGTSPCWGIDETLEGDSPQEALTDWIDFNREFLREKAETLGCEIEELAEVSVAQN